MTHERWERVATREGDIHRMEVPGGWLYRYLRYDGTFPPAMAIAFVPRSAEEERSRYRL